MNIQPSTCIGMTQSGKRCSKKPVSGKRYCNSHRRSYLLARAEKREEDESRMLNYRENNPEYCPRCRQYDCCLCGENAELCPRCGLRDGCYCREVPKVTSKPTTPICEVCQEEIKKRHEKLPLDHEQVTIRRTAHHYHGRCLKRREAAREGREDEWANEMLTEKMKALLINGIP